MDATNQKSYGYLSFIKTTIAPMIIYPDEKIEQYREQYLKALQGDCSSQFYLGYRYATGEGVEQSYKQAASWYHKAAVQGCSASQYNLGLLYKQGDGVEQSNRKATECFYKAALDAREDAKRELIMMLLKPDSFSG